jgi:hypothetical protein
MLLLMLLAVAGVPAVADVFLLLLEFLLLTMSMPFLVTMLLLMFLAVDVIVMPCHCW